MYIWRLIILTTDILAWSDQIGCTSVGALYPSIPVTKGSIVDRLEVLLNASTRCDNSMHGHSCEVVSNPMDIP